MQIMVGMKERAGASTAGRNASAPEDVYLGILGERVRNARARRGMTRKALSVESGVSERYLAQLETGNGNISILLLRQIAIVLREPLEELVNEAQEKSPAHKLINQQIGRLDGNGIAELQRWLSGRTREGSSRDGKIALIGLRGAGKSTLGRLVADHFKIPFVEITQEIERLAGMSQSEIFSLYGQSAYRRYELQAIEEATNRPGPQIIAAGGGLPTELPTFDLLLSRCTVIWLKARPEDHMSRVRAQGDLRPMAGNDAAMHDLKLILDQRSALYGTADATFDTSGLTVERAARKLASLVAKIAPSVRLGG